MEKNLEIRHFEKEDARFATPKEIADFRAKKLKCKRIVDLCCGIGAQSFAFSKTCGKVFGIEIDKRKSELAKKNCDLENVKIMQGDVLSERIVNEVKEFKPEIIFCDTERPENENEREMENIKPNLKKLVAVYSKICPKLCIEIPPQIELEKLKGIGDFEAEYISYKNKLNRLELNFGELIEAKISVVDVSGVKIKSTGAKEKKTKKIKKYLFEVSSAVIRAEIVGEFADKIGAEILSEEKNKVLLTSDELSEFSKDFSNRYLVLVSSKTKEGILKQIKKENTGKVVLKIKVSPEEYWKERNFYEKDARGDKEASLFFANGEFILAELIDVL